MHIKHLMAKANGQLFYLKGSYKPGGDYKPRIKQIYEMLQFFARYQLAPDEYFLYQFYKKDKKISHMLQFMPQQIHINVYRPKVNSPKWNIILDNKLVFHSYFSGFDICLPVLWGYYHDNTGMTTDGESLRSPEELKSFLFRRQPESLVIKPVDGSEGKGVLVLNDMNYEGDELRGVANTKDEFTYAKIITFMKEVKHKGWLIEEKVGQHPFLSGINPYTTNTFRIVTFNHENNIDIHFSVLRLGRRGIMSDNCRYGGLSVYVDPDSGRLGRGCFTRPQYGDGWFESHPDTGVSFFAKQVPMWEDIISLCKRAARMLPHVHSIGWDVILGPEGPVLLEGNPGWGIRNVQIHSEGYLREDIRGLLSQYGLHFPSEKLPLLNPGLLGRAVLNLLRSVKEKVNEDY